MTKWKVAEGIKPKEMMEIMNDPAKYKEWCEMTERELRRRKPGDGFAVVEVKNT